MFIFTELMINDEIRDREVRLIGEAGEQLGVVTLKQAMTLAEEKDLDLVKIAPKGIPPVCKIMNYSKYRFEMIKHDKEMRKHQKVINIKEVQLSVMIGEHDLMVKAKNAMRFLKEGEKVKVVLRFKGRQMAHTELGVTLMNHYFELVEEFGVIEKPAKLEGRNMIMFIKAKE